MRTLVLTAIVMLAGCGSLTPMEELEKEALFTGDWSKVEQREDMLARRAAHSGPTCPHGQVALCESYMGEARCSCVRSERLQSVLAPAFR